MKHTTFLAARAFGYHSVNQSAQAKVCSSENAHGADSKTAESEEDAEGAVALTVGVFRDARRLLPHAQALGLQVISHLQAKLHTPAHTLSRAQGKVLKCNGLRESDRRIDVA